jgi:clan AA aspartic protease
MGMIFAKLEIIRADDEALFREGSIKKTDIRSVKVRAIVDTGSHMMAINQNIVNQLKLHTHDSKTVMLADGSIGSLNVVGPIKIKFENRTAICSALVLPGNTDVLLGAIPMEEMDVLIDPKNQQLIVNPETPYQARVMLV